MIRRLFAPVFFIFAVLFLGGCFFDKPLTDHPSKDINTWLLGVWEHRDDKDKLYRVTVTPDTGSRYAVTVKITGPSPRDAKTWRFEGWISRVGKSLFLTLKCLENTNGDIPIGSYSFLHYQVADQNHVITRTLQLDSPPDASSYQLRVEVRRKLKENTLYPDTHALWNRVSEVYWSSDPFAPQPVQPLRYPPKENR